MNRKSLSLIVEFGIVGCILGAIWSPDWMKWLLTALYLYITSRYFLGFRKEKIVGEFLIRKNFVLKDFVKYRSVK